jgi:hypothetical protein
MTSLAAVADELYGLRPDEFTAARDAAAKAARDDGDGTLAAEVKRLRRPTIGAWLVNQLARSDAAGLDELLDVGEELRAAQEALDGAQLRTMTRRRRDVIQALSQTAAELATAAGLPFGAAAQREVEATLDAALADETAAGAVRTGRLMRGLVSTGLEAVEIGDAVAAPDTAPPPRRAGTAKPASRPPAKTAKTTAKGTAGTSGAKSGTRRDARRTAAERAARQEVERAQQAFASAEAELGQRDEELGTAREAVRAARSRIAELDAALSEASKQLSAAEGQRRRADQAKTTAARERASAKRALDAAERKVRS